MGLFSTKKKTTINWNQLSDVNQLDEIIEVSKEKPVMLFKHSTRCSISMMALNRVEGNWDFSEDEIAPYYLDLLSYRDISSAIAEKFDVFHQSPQMIIVKNGNAILDASHNEVRVELLKDIIE